MSTDPRHHDRWIKLSNWRDSKDHRTGLRASDLIQVADFCARVREQLTCDGDWRHLGREFAWQVDRQRTEREGTDGRGSYWEGPFATGAEPTLAKAKSAATAALRKHRMTHILAGGDVGYGSAPAGEQIRQALAGRRR